MAIEKIIRISNIGRLRALRSVGDMTFRRFNLILAENGRGKSTFCAVLRSLQTGDVSHIRARQTVGVTDPTGAEIRIAGDTVRFDGNAWSRTMPELLIFDTTFITDNVYVGDSVGTDNKRNLLQVMLGSRGHTLADRVSALVERVREITAEIVTLKGRIAARLERGADVDSFVALAEIPELDAVIARTETALSAIRHSAELQARSSVEAVSIPSIPEDFLELLSSSLDGISIEAEERVKQQITHHQMSIHGESWLATGVPYVVDEQCPFCGEATAENALIQHYKDYFSEAYKSHKMRLDAMRRSLDDSLGEATRQKFVGDVLRNEGAVDFWKAYATDLPYVTFKGQEIVFNVLRALYAEAARLMDAKLTAPLEAVTPDASYLEAVAAYERLKPLFDSYVEAIDPTDTLIRGAKKAAGVGDRRAVEAELRRLHDTQIRFSDGVRDDVRAYAEALTLKGTIEVDRDAAKAELDAYADGELSQYQEEINRILRRFGASFSVDGTARSYVGRTPTSSYRFLIDQNPVELGDETTMDRPCFKTSMSAGDKSALALAFFLAHLERDPDRANRVVIFDDPFTSFDGSRREETAQMICRVGENCAQVVVLSHDPGFLSLLVSRIPTAGDVRLLQLSRVGRDSTLAEWDAGEAGIPPYKQDLMDIRAYVDGAATDASKLDIIRKMRPILEGFFRRKFPGMFAEGIWLGTMLEQIRDDGADHALASVYDEVTSINDYTKRYFHEGDPEPTEEPINETELDSFCRRTMGVVGGW